MYINSTYRGIAVNNIRTLFPKDLHEWLFWIDEGRTLYLDKEKVQNLIAQQRIHLAEVNNLDLNSVNNIIQNFQNPSVSEKNPEKTSGTYTEYEDTDSDLKLSAPGDRDEKSSTSAKSSTGISQPFPDYRGLPDNEQNIASAALQYVEHDHNIAPTSKKVNRYFDEVKKILSGIIDGNHICVNFNL